MMKNILIKRISEQHRSDILALANQFDVPALTEVQLSLVNIAYYSPNKFEKYHEHYKRGLKKCLMT